MQRAQPGVKGTLGIWRDVVLTLDMVSVFPQPFDPIMIPSRSITPPTLSGPRKGSVQLFQTRLLFIVLAISRHVGEFIVLKP
jgi:hypothetical protein